MSLTRAVVSLVLTLGLPLEIRAQCPDGSPPPCGERRAPYVSRATRRLPDSVRVLYDRAVAEGRRRTVDGARESFALLSRVIAFDSNYAPAWAMLAQVSTQSWIRRWQVTGAGRDSLLSLATRASRRAVQLDSGLAGAWVVYGRAAAIVDVTDRSASRHAFSRALALDPRSVDALLGLGLLEEDLLRPRAAEQAWTRALGVAPTNLEALAFLALHHHWRSSDERARRLTDSALAIDPTYSVAREAAGEIALAQKRWADAERHGTILLTTSGAQEPAVAYAILARAAAGRDAVGDARRYLQDAEREAHIEEPTRHASIFVAAAWAQLGDTARAMEWLRAYTPREDLHFQLHLKREPGLRWVARAYPALLAPAPSSAER
jgi:tetratricopeptide (TPR) repeat protein